MPDGISEKVDFSKTVTTAEIKNDSTDALSKFKEAAGSKIGSMGWIEGSIKKPSDTKNKDGTVKYDTYKTYNLGFESADKCGIVLKSKTNVKIENPKNGAYGIYFEGRKLEADMNNEINPLDYLDYFNEDYTEGMKKILCLR